MGYSVEGFGSVTDDVPFSLQGSQFRKNPDTWAVVLAMAVKEGLDNCLPENGRKSGK